jgi:hypothetical protein
MASRWRDVANTRLGKGCCLHLSSRLTAPAEGLLLRLDGRIDFEELSAFFQLAFLEQSFGTRCELSEATVPACLYKMDQGG